MQLIGCDGYHIDKDIYSGAFTRHWTEPHKLDTTLGNHEEKQETWRRLQIGGFKIDSGRAIGSLVIQKSGGIPFIDMEVGG